MKKTIIKIFGVVITLVIIFLAYQFLFNKNGAIKTGVDGVGSAVNDVWKEVTGTDTNIIQSFDGAGVTSEGDMTDILSETVE